MAYTSSLFKYIFISIYHVLYIYIYISLHNQAKELEKIKFVLDYKYKELKKEMEPKEAQIAHMKEQARK